MKDWNLLFVGNDKLLVHTCPSGIKCFMCAHFDGKYICSLCHAIAPEEIAFVAELGQCWQYYTNSVERAIINGSK